MLYELHAVHMRQDAHQRAKPPDRWNDTHTQFFSKDSGREPKDCSETPSKLWVRATTAGRAQAKPKG